VIVFDTNVISALMRADPDPSVARWFDGLPSESVWTTSITLFEVQSGIERLAAGRRRRQLVVEFAKVLAEDIQDRVLSFDVAAAQEAALLAVRRERRGEPIDFRDTLIAGIVLSRRAEFATRNLRHFRDLSVTVVDPWAA
jgi:predicted nucleic acid-binding protein